MAENIEIPEEAYKPISCSDKHLRKAMHEAFGGKCFYTGREISLRNMHIDHIIPKAKGGADCIANYVASSADANMSKKDKTSDDFKNVVVQYVGMVYVKKVVRLLEEHGGNLGPKRPYAQQNAQRRSIYTDDDTWAKLKELGKGNASAGIREAVRRAEEQNK